MRTASCCNGRARPLPPAAKNRILSLKSESAALLLREGWPIIENELTIQMSIKGVERMQKKWLGLSLSLMLAAGIMRLRREREQ